MIKKRHAETELSFEERNNVVRVRNSIYALSQVLRNIDPDSIIDIYNKSLALGFHPKDMIVPQNIITLMK